MWSALHNRLTSWSISPPSRMRATVGRSQLTFRVGVGLGGDAAQVRCLRHRHLEEIVGDDAVRKPAGNGLVPSIEATAEQHFLGTVSARVTHHLQRGDRKRHSDADF